MTAFADAACAEPPETPAEWGLYVTWRRPRIPWPHEWIRCPDFGIPLHGAEARHLIAEAHRRCRDGRVEIACGGGRGRTGTVLAAMAMLDGLGSTDAIAWVRRHYDPRAVETPWQRRWLSRRA